mmetsp:Transcript_34741/g.87359  ORF Transcript_34741/g.87359 Transcript_34741/m.87359 type:complete len:209 (+) Transcript_34741:1208-1834(+)
MSRSGSAMRTLAPSSMSRLSASARPSANRSESTLAHAIQPCSYGSSTRGKKKSVVLTWKRPLCRVRTILQSIPRPPCASSSSAAALSFSACVSSIEEEEEEAVSKVLFVVVVVVVFEEDEEEEEEEGVTEEEEGRRVIRPISSRSEFSFSCGTLQPHPFSALKEVRRKPGGRPMLGGSNSSAVNHEGTPLPLVLRDALMLTDRSRPSQ